MRSSALPMLEPEVLERHVRPGPRYTSYPPATQFHDGVDGSVAGAELDRLRTEDRSAPVSLYAHIPFCRSLCWYCGCNVIATRDRERGLAYLDTLTAEIAMIGERLGGGRALSELSLGGGSPNFLPPEGLRRLSAAVRAAFRVLPDAELGIELDPRDTTEAQIAALAAEGFTRMSVGIQDFSPEVQQAIHREQSAEQTALLLASARARGFRTVNCDLVYGLARQTPESFAATLDAVIGMRPDRIALFGYAHLPHLRPHQKLVERGGPLPDTEARAALLGVALERFDRAGYVRVGMDHFALPDDALARAAADGELHRNFQGYVVPRARYLLACGTTGISDSGGAYWQNHGDLKAWAEAVERGELPVARGVVLDADDRIRREAINRLMCDGALELADLDRRCQAEAGVDADVYFATELAELEAPEQVELVAVDRLRRRIEATSLGRLLIRNVAMVFDRYLRAAASAGGPRPRFSATL
jgi:oxygen-independent coproporphyrinogen III oxidase